MKRIFFVLTLLVSFSSSGQAPDSLFSFSFSKIPFEKFVSEVETKTHYKFFYLNRWVDTLHVSAEIREAAISEVLKKALTGTKAQFYILGERIILTNNVPIIESKIAFESIDRNAGRAQVNYSFTREELQQETTEKLSDAIKPIGIRRPFYADEKFTVSGYIREEKSGEPLPGASVYLKDGAGGTTSNTAGFYTITIPNGSHDLFVQFAGMKPLKQRIVVYGDGSLNFNLKEEIVALQEVLVQADADLNVENMQMGAVALDMKHLKVVPKALGENDILKIALTTPGVKTIGEGSAGLNVRGGNADQNLFLLNDAPVYNPSHFLGFFSIFNADVIKSSELYKSGIPAQYGGRLSSLFNIQTKDGNLKKFSGQGGIGPVASRLSLEIPIVKDKTSLMIGGRTTYSNWILRLLDDPKLKNSDVSFYDVVGRLTHHVNEKNSIHLSVYYSKDKFNLSTDSLFGYHNLISSMQWRHTGNKQQSTLTATYSGYQYDLQYTRVPQNAFKLGFDINESSVKWDFSKYFDRHTLDYGVQSKLYNINPGTRERASPESIVVPKYLSNESGLENAIYVADNFEITPKLSVYGGVRYSIFSALGPADINQYKAGGVKDESTVIDTISYSKGQVVKTYAAPEWRASFRYTLNRTTSIKASYNRTRQYIHMLSNTISVTPTNTWKLSDPNIKPQTADQVSLGFYKNVKSNSIEASVEVYYKHMQNILDYKIGSELLLNDNLETAVLQGQGKAYGAEFLLMKKAGKLNGWVSYTYSRTFIQMNSPVESERVNNGAYFPANYDKPHDFNLVSNYRVTRRYSMSFNFVYSTGRPITYPVASYKFGNGYRIHYSDRNAYRIPDYVRLDLGFNLEGNHRVKKLAHSFWSFSIYNVLGRKNPYSIFFVSSGDKINAYKLSVFGAPIPTITYNFTF
jgi:hypothetical protein